MTNLLVNPRIGLLFLVTGMNETLRINGTARITDDARLLAPSAVNNRPPKVGLVVKIEEALLHCAKALVRSALWDASRHIERAILPTYAQMLLDHVKGLTQAADAGYGRARALLREPRELRGGTTPMADSPASVGPAIPRELSAKSFRTHHRIDAAHRGRGERDSEYVFNALASSPI